LNSNVVLPHKDEKIERAKFAATALPPMPILNGKYWEERYRASDIPWDKGEASPGLVDFLAAHPELKRGTVCVPGCGTGHDVRAWAKAGFDAVGYDLAPSAAQLGRERTAAAGLTARFELGDFLKDVPPFLFEWVFEHTLFCAIDPRDRDDYVKAVLRGINEAVFAALRAAGGMGAAVLSESDRTGIDALVETKGVRMTGGIHSTRGKIGCKSAARRPSFFAYGRRAESG
jgi:hypothetical protein